MSRARIVLRWAHIVAGVWIAVFVLSPLRLDPTAVIAAQVTVIGLTMSGAAMWQLPRLVRAFRHRS